MIGSQEATPTPLFHQIFLVLREQIADGTYLEGAILPGEQHIAATFGVARVTAKRALDELASRGLVRRRRGRGTEVIFRAPQHSVEGSVESLLRSLRRDGRNGRNVIRLESFEYLPAPPKIATALGIQAGDDVQRAIRIRHASDRPYGILETYVPQDIGRKFTREDLVANPLYLLLDRVGVKIARAEQTFFATLADARNARRLGVQVGAPLLRIVRTVFDESGRPVEHLFALYRSDMYHYRMVMSRTGGAPDWVETPAR